MTVLPLRHREASAPSVKLNGNDKQYRRLPAARLERMRAISKRTAKLLRQGWPPIEHGELLYDEQGLPKSTQGEAEDG